MNKRAHLVPVPVKPFNQIGLNIKHATPSEGGHRYIVAAIDYLANQALVERFNRTLDSCLKKRSATEKANWDHYLPAAAFAYRSIKQSTTTGQSPFFLLYGYEPVTYFDNSLRPIDVKEPSFELQLKIRTTIQIQYLNNVRKDALDKIKKSQALQVKRLENKMHNPKKEWKPSFNIGDVVKLYRDNLSTSWSAKISIRWYEDNFCIQEKHKKGSYLIKNISNPEDPRLHLVHGNRLKPYLKPTVNWDKQYQLISN